MSGTFLPLYMPGNEVLAVSIWDLHVDGQRGLFRGLPKRLALDLLSLIRRNSTAKTQRSPRRKEKAFDRSAVHWDKGPRSSLCASASLR